MPYIWVENNIARLVKLGKQQDELERIINVLEYWKENWK